MDTNLNIPTAKKVSLVQLPNGSNKGFGWNGEFTRDEWRRTCLINFKAGAEQFATWQNSWKDLINLDLPQVRLEARLIYDDGTNEIILDDFYESHEAYDLDFVGQIFEEKIDGANRYFGQHALFNGATFKSGAFFTDAKFQKNINFGNAIFLSNVSFRSAYFNFFAGFDSVFFANNLDFAEAIILGYATFSGTNFCGISNFDGTNFPHVDFSSHTKITKFWGDVSFRSVTFEYNANFFKTEFINQCRFDNTFDKNTLTWNKETSFARAVNFENAKILNVGHFERVQFNGEIPNFLGVDNSKTLLIFSGDKYFSKSDTWEDAVNRISQLKRLSDEQGQNDQAMMFNAIELNAKRAQLRLEVYALSFIYKLGSADYWSANITDAYAIFSNYGRSFTKPIFWYGILICLSALFAMIYSTYSDSPPEEQQVLCKPIEDQPPPLKLPYGRAVVEYAMFRAGGLMDFTDTGKQNNAVNCRLFEEPIEPSLMRAWGIFKGIASTALLFLAALGLRNKYRIK
jgi:uncharacterized protein YjbI with pentapeptide repeats